MLAKIRIEKFKSYKAATLQLGPLTVLIGANASGKSNAIEAIQLLSWLAQGNRLGSIRYAVYEDDEAIRGTVATLGFRGSPQFTLSCEIDDSSWHSFSITLGLGEDDDLHILDERIVGSDTTVPLYEVIGSSEGAGSDLRVAYNNFARGGKKPQVTTNDQMVVFLQLQSSARFETGHKAAQTQIPEICSRYQSLLSNIIFLDPQPTLMRSYSFNTERRLLNNGSNLSGVLFNLCADEAVKADILTLIKSLPEQDINSISFIETPRGEVMLQLEETFGGHLNKFDATLLSDGTLRVLSIGAAVLSAPENSIVVIEEIDNGVHPSRAEQLLESLSEIAKRRDLRIVISSHNPALLDALPDDAVPNVAFCYRDAEDGASQLIRLAEVPNYPELIAQGRVGHLMTRGLIDRFVKMDSSLDKKKQKALDWLENIA